MINRILLIMILFIFVNCDNSRLIAPENDECTQSNILEDTNVRNVVLENFGDSIVCMVLFYPEGKIKAIGYYREGRPDGYWVNYYQNGIIRTEGYINEGKQNGICFYYYPDGQVKMYGLRKDGNKVGKWVYFNPDGSIEKIRYF